MATDGRSGSALVVEGGAADVTVVTALISVLFRRESGFEDARPWFRGCSPLYSGRPSLELLREDEGRSTLAVSKSRRATFARAVGFEVGGLS